MAKREIEISRHETNHSIAREYVIVYDNGLVEIRRNVHQKLDGNEVNNPENRLTIEQLKNLVQQLA